MPLGIESNSYHPKHMCKVLCNSTRGRRSTSSSRVANASRLDGLLGRGPFTGMCSWRKLSTRLPPGELVKQRWCTLCHVAQRSCFREEYYTGMRRFNSARKDSRLKPKKTIHGESTAFFFDIYGLIISFGLALLCGLRKVVMLLWIATGLSRKSI